MSSTHTHSKKSQSLTKNQRIVLDLLQNSGEPLKAYFILDSLKKEGLNSPLQVYRALDKLVELGKIHKIESINSLLYVITQIVRATPLLPFARDVER